MAEKLEWKRTGKITTRAGEYLIIRYPKSGYMALYGPQTARKTIGQYQTADEAKNACQGHLNGDDGQKNTGA